MNENRGGVEESLKRALVDLDRRDTGLERAVLETIGSRTPIQMAREREVALLRGVSGLAALLLVLLALLALGLKREETARPLAVRVDDSELIQIFAEPTFEEFSTESAVLTAMFLGEMVQ